MHNPLVTSTYFSRFCSRSFGRNHMLVAYVHESSYMEFVTRSKFQFTRNQLIANNYVASSPHTTAASQSHCHTGPWCSCSDEDVLATRWPNAISTIVIKVKFSHTRYRALGPELIQVYRQSAPEGDFKPSTRRYAAITYFPPGRLLRSFHHMAPTVYTVELIRLQLLTSLCLYFMTLPGSRRLRPRVGP